jgi:TRAP-type C4-dicarboxylate transport system substrate-binding protein
MALSSLSPASALAAPPETVLRFATVAPDGSPWAREVQAFARAVERGTDGRVHVKLYMNGVAGDELEMGERMRKGQLEGAASGQILCERLGATLRIAHLPGLFQNRDEAAAVMNGLQDALAVEFHQHGFVFLAITGLGPTVFFTRTPARSLGELRQLKLWRWDLDEVGIAASRAMGLQIVPESLQLGGRAYDDKRIDGFAAIPAAALAFQWSAQVRYVVDLRPDYLWGCLLMTESSFNRLPPRDQAAVREAAARLSERFEDVGRRIDEQLLGGVFQKQGLTALPVSERFRAEFFAAARAAREQLTDKWVPRELITRVQQMLADWRAEHPSAH